jgi:hypothetical protein
MSASRQYAAPSGVDAQHLASSNINPDSPTSQPSNGGHSASRDTGNEDAALNILCHTAANLGYMQHVGYGFDGSCVRSGTISRADYQSTNSEAGASQQDGSHGITNLPETVGTGNALEKPGSVGLNKRRREQTSNLSTVDDTRSKPRFPLC